MLNAIKPTNKNNNKIFIRILSHSGPLSLVNKPFVKFK